MADQVYYNGDFYQVKTATAEGENPTNASAKFSKVQIPARWRWILSKLTYANLLEADGQKDKAMAERAIAMGDERRGLDYIIREAANREGFLERPHVRQRH